MRLQPIQKMSDPVVFFDVSLGPKEIGRVKIQLFAQHLPRTCENFRQFCTGETRNNGIPVGYKGSKFHRIIRGFMIQGGDFVSGNGKGSHTIFGTNTFEDESFQFKRKYSLGMH